jgi:hypothetical protein
MIAVGVLYFLLTRSRAYTRRLRDGNLAGGAQRAGRRQCTADAIGEDGGERSIHGSAPVCNGYVKKVFPPLQVYACAVSPLPRHLLGRFLSLQYLAVVNQLGPSQLP